MAIDKIFNDANVDGIADNIFGAVNNSVSEVKQMQQRKAAENVQMVVEAFKKIETNITEKFNNVTDVIEKRVLTIKDGRDGSSGSDGRNGRDGKPGRDGVNGKQGIPGTPGKDGVDGEDGVSVTNANIDFDGSLVISLSSGQQINVGEVVAPDLAEKIKIVSTMSTNGAVGIKDEGSSISTGVKNINFVGATVTATASGDDVTVNVSAGTGTVTSVAATVPAFLSVAGSPVTTTGTLAISLSGTALPVANGGTGLTSGTSGGVLAYTATGTLASSAALAASALVIGGGAGAAPSTTTTGTGVVTALGVNTGTAGAFVVNGGVLGTPSSGTVTNLTGTASININGTVGATTASTGAFTSLTTSSTVTVNGGTATINNLVNTVGQSATLNLTTFNTNFGSSNTLQLLTTLNNTTTGASTSTFKQFNHNQGSDDVFITKTSGDAGYLAISTGTGAAEVARFTTTGLAVTGTLSATSTASATIFYPTVTSGTGIQMTSTGNNNGNWTIANNYGQMTIATEGTAGSLVTGSSQGAALFGNSSNVPAQFFTNNTVRATIDSSGNLGLGVTPSAWTTVTPVIQTGTGSFYAFNNEVRLSSNFFFNGADRYIQNGFATSYNQASGQHKWFTAASGTAGNAISFTQAMTLDASGNLGIGTTSPSTYGKLAVNSTAAAGANVAITKENSGTANQNGQVLYFNNSHPAATGRNANVVAGQIIWQFSQPSSGALQYAGEIAVLSDAQGGTSSASSLNLYSSGGRGLIIDSGTFVTMPAYGAGAATFSASGVISSVSDETWKIKDGVPVDTDAMLKKLEPGYWYYNDEKKQIFGADRQLGFYAQNVNAAIGPEAAPTPEEGKPWGYYDRSVLAITVMSLQKALATIELLTARITALETA